MFGVVVALSWRSGQQRAYSYCAHIEQRYALQIGILTTYAAAFERHGASDQELLRRTSKDFEDGAILMAGVDSEHTSIVLPDRKVYRTWYGLWPGRSIGGAHIRYAVAYIADGNTVRAVRYSTQVVDKNREVHTVWLLLCRAHLDREIRGCGEKPD